MTGAFSNLHTKSVANQRFDPQERWYYGISTTLMVERQGISTNRALLHLHIITIMWNKMAAAHELQRVYPQKPLNKIELDLSWQPGASISV